VAIALVLLKTMDRRREAATVAVLPMPTDSTGEHWSEIGEYILDRLAKVNGLRTVPSSSTQPLQLAKLDARTIAQRLNARYAISVQTKLAQTKDSLRARIELVDARTNVLAWSHTYRFPIDSVLYAQDEIASDVITAITGDSPGPAGGVPVPASATAYDLYLQGTFQLMQRTPAALERARGLFAEAIERDSTYAKAYSRLADAYNMLGSYDYGSLQPSVAYGQARVAAERARVLDPELDGPHAALANVYMNFDWDFRSAEQEFRAALRMNPGCPECRQWLGLLYVATGRTPEAIAQVDSAIIVDSGSPLAFTTRAQVHYYAGDFETAASSLARALEIQRDFNRAHLMLAVVDYQRGRANEAIGRLTSLLAIQEEPLLLCVLAYMHGQTGGMAQAERYYQRLQAVSAQRYVPAEYHAVASIGMNRIDDAFRYLNEAAARHSGGMVYLTVEPLLKPIHSDPRFAKLVESTRH
jgi:tetratricopeptide (TPR) repeat protein